MNRTDSDLVNAWLHHHEQDAFTTLYNRYADPVRFAMGRALGGFCASEVDELVQDFWAKLPELLPAWDPERGSLRTYLVVQASWAARSAEAKRRRRRAARRVDELPVRAPDPGSSRCLSAWSLAHCEGPEQALDSAGARKGNLSAAIERYLTACGDRPAKVLGAWLDGRSGRDIAQDLNLHPAQISRDLERARRRLATDLPGLLGMPVGGPAPLGAF